MSEEPKKPFYWQLEPGDRVVFWDRERGDILGTISKVTDAYFFPYWVEWDPPWGGKITEGAFQISCFDWREMDRRGFRPDRPWRPYVRPSEGEVDGLDRATGDAPRDRDHDGAKRG